MLFQDELVEEYYSVAPVDCSLCVLHEDKLLIQQSLTQVLQIAGRKREIEFGTHGPNIKQE